MNILFFFLFTFFLNSVSHGEVDLKNGNFFFSAIDFEFSSGNIFWQLQRSYNSRENRVGYFGQGWCSPLESKLSVPNESTLHVQNCGSGEIVKYTRTGDEWLNSDQAISLIDEKYVLKVKGTTQLQFSKDGNLDAFWLRDEKAKLIYLNGKLNRLESPAGNLIFNFDHDGKVISIKSDNGKTASYSYTGENLTEVTNAWGNTFYYEYDKLGNMISAKWPDKSEMSMIYDTTRDWITSVTDREQCTEKYGYAIKKSGADTKTISTAERKCLKKSKQKKSVAVVTSKDEKLKSVRYDSASGWKEIQYNDFGKPSVIKSSNAGSTSFEYDKHGSFVQKSSGSKITQYIRNSKKQIVQIKAPDKNLALSYDERGRVTQISLSSKNQDSIGELTVSYVDTSEKLKKVELKKSGHVSYTYDSGGSIVDSKIQASEQSNESDLQSSINQIFGTYTTLTDEAAILGGIE